jgi:hypothetical protein
MNKKIIIIVILSIIAIGGGVAYYMWNKPKTNAADVKPNYILPADSLGAAFAKNEDAANAKFVKDSVALEIQGVVDTVFVNEGNESVIQLTTTTPDYAVKCYFLAGEKVTAAKGEKVVIKGFCTGYLMMDGVQMSKCALIK